MEISLVLNVLLAACGFLAVFVLQGIKGEIRDLRSALSCIERDFREGLSGLDRRVGKIETKCSVFHGGHGEPLEGPM